MASGRCFSESPFHKGYGVWGPSVVKVSIPLAFFVRLGHLSKSEFSKGLPGLIWSASPAFNRWLDQKPGLLPGVQPSAFFEVPQAMLCPGEPG